MTTKLSIRKKFFQIQIELLTDDDEIEIKRKEMETIKRKAVECIEKLREMEKKREAKKSILSQLESILELNEEECVSGYNTIKMNEKEFPTDDEAERSVKKSAKETKKSARDDKRSTNDAEGLGKGSTYEAEGSTYEAEGPTYKAERFGKYSKGSGKNGKQSDNNESSIINGKGPTKYEHTLYDQIPPKVKEFLEISDDEYPVLESTKFDTIKNKETIWNSRSFSSIVEKKSYETSIKGSDKDYGKGGSIDKKDLKYELAVKKMTNELNNSSYGHNEKVIAMFSLKMIIHACNSIIKVCNNYDNSKHGEKTFVYKTLYNMLWHKKNPGKIMSEESRFVQKYIDEFLDKYPEFIKYSMPVDF